MGAADKKTGKDNGFELEKRDQQKPKEDGHEEEDPVPEGRISMRSVRRQGDEEEKDLYTLRVIIHECRDLKSRDSSGSSDPFVEVRWGADKEKTSVKKDTLSPYYDENFIFERKMTLDDMQTSKIDISVFDRDFFRKTLIGKVMIGIPNLYMSPGHEYFKRWLPLTDTTDKHEGTQGYVNLSCSLLGSGDEALVHTEEEATGDDQGDLQAMVLSGPSIKQVGYSLNIKVYKVEHVHKMDRFTQSDPYVQVLYGGVKARTKTLRGKKDGPVLEEMRIPVMFPGMSDVIQVGLINGNIIGKDDVIGTASFNFSKIKNKPVGPFWVNFYGEESRESMGNAQILDYNGEQGTAYRGRVLMALGATKKDEPALKSGIRIGSCKDPKNQNWLLRCDLYDGSEVPFDGNYEFEVACGPKRVKSKSVSSKNNFVRWYEQLKELQMDMPVDLDQVPDIFVNIYHSSAFGRNRRRVAFARFDAADVAKFVDRPEWLLLSTPPGLELEIDQLPGYYLFQLSLVPGNEAGSRLPIEKPDDKKFLCRVFVYQARNLPAADDGGDNDPYVEVKIAGKRKKVSSVINGTNHPQWYEAEELEIKMSPRRALQPPLQCLVMDKDFLGSDMIGRVTLYPSDYRVEFPGEPQWRGVYVNDPDETEGELLVSCQMVRMDAVAFKSLPKIKTVNIQPKVKSCDIEISTIGLRGLRIKDMSINAPYVKFVLGNGGTAMQTKPSNKPDVDNPNHLETTVINTELPINPIFAPTLTLRVMDEKRGVNDTIGVGAIDLGDYMPWAAAWKVKREAELAARMQRKARLALGMMEGDDDDELTEGNAPKMGPDESDGVAGENGKKGKNTVAPMDQAAPPPVIMPDAPIAEDRRQHLMRVAEVKEKIEIARGKPRSNEDGFMDGGVDEDAEETVENRPHVDGELEDHVDMHPFKEYFIKRGRSRGLTAKELAEAEKAKEEPNGCVAFMQCTEEDSGGYFLEADSTAEGTVQTVCKFIGNVRIIEEDKKKVMPPAIDLPEVFKPQAYVVRVYVVEAFSLTAMDIGGKADPYIKINLGGEVIHEDKEHGCKNTLTPEWYRLYECNANLPGESLLSVEVWDSDMIGKDDMIGKTTIDLETRLFSKEWQALEKKPNEVRALRHPKRKGEQGKLKMWVEILSVRDAKSIRPFPIKLPVPIQYVLRMVVWDVQKAIFPNDEERCDLQVTGQLIGNKGHEETDVHWGAKDGVGSFNWRFVFPLMLPYKGRGKAERIRLALWDHDTASENDLIGEAQLNLHSFFRRAFQTPKKPQQLTRQYVAVQHPDFGHQTRGEIQVEMWLGTEEIATLRPAGKGRDKPNSFPHLPPPDRHDSYPWWRIDKLILRILGKYKWHCLLLFCLFGTVFVIIAGILVVLVGTGQISIGGL